MPPALIHLVQTTASLTLWLFLLAIIFVPLEWLFAVNRQSTLRAGLAADLGYYFANGLIPTFVLAFPLGVIAATGRQLLPAGYQIWVIGLPIWLQIVAALIIGEFGFYWGHRIMHRAPWLWKFHATHHQPVRMDWLINTRAHPIDIIFTRMFGLSLVAIAGLGSPGFGSGSLVPVIVLLIGTFWAFFIHANLKVGLGWFEHILSSPRFHHWHHSRDDHPNHNFASVLPIYDRIFGTHYLPGKQWPPSYGISAENEPDAIIAARSSQPAEDPAAPDTA